MAGDAQKTWLQNSLNRFGQKKAAEAIQQLGRSLPCSVAAIPTAGIPVVTVKFELKSVPFTIPNVTVPVFGFEYIRFPIQVGCKGAVFPLDVMIDNISGMSDAVPDLSTLPANLSALVFMPIGNAKWTASDTPNKLVLYGPEGVVIRTISGDVKTTWSDDGVVIDIPAGKKATVNGDTEINGQLKVNGNLIVTGNMEIGGQILGDAGGTYAGDIVTTGEVIAKSGAGQVGLSTHTHTQPNDSHNDVEQPTAAPTGGT